MSMSDENINEYLSKYTINELLVLYAIPASLIDDNCENVDKGVDPCYGTTREEIQKKTSLSYTKISETLVKLTNDGLIVPGVSIGRIKTYAIDKKGTNLLSSIGMDILNKYLQDRLATINKQKSNTEIK